MCAPKFEKRKRNNHNEIMESFLFILLKKKIININIFISDWWEVVIQLHWIFIASVHFTHDMSTCFRSSFAAIFVVVCIHFQTSIIVDILYRLFAFALADSAVIAMMTKRITLRHAFSLVCQFFFCHRNIIGDDSSTTLFEVNQFIVSLQFTPFKLSNLLIKNCNGSHISVIGTRLQYFRKSINNKWIKLPLKK